MSNFQVGDRVQRTDSDLKHTEPDIAGRFMSGEVFTVVGVLGTHNIKLSGLPYTWSKCDFSLVSEDTSKYYKHYDIVIAWMQGKTVQVKSGDGVWTTLSNPVKRETVPYFSKRNCYRVKPETCPKEGKLKSLVNKLEEQLKEAQGQLKELRNE